MPDEVVRLAKIAAAKRDTSVSALVGELLVNALGQDDYDQVWADEEALMRKGALRVGPVTWARNDVHSH